MRNKLTTFLRLAVIRILRLGLRIPGFRDVSREILVKMAIRYFRHQPNPGVPVTLAATRASVVAGRQQRDRNAKKRETRRKQAKKSRQRNRLPK